MPATSFEFPFEYAVIDRLGRLFYPTVWFDIETIYGWRTFSLLVDTGADVTTVPVHLLPVLGLRQSDLPYATTLGVGGFEVKTWEFKLSLRLGNIQIIVNASAVDAKHDAMPLLLGRKDIFEEKFNLFLDSRRKITVISHNR